jgi:hypothetical protein
VEAVQKPSVKRKKRREPLVFAYIGLILFMVVYFARPEDWIPGFAGLPLAKITGVLILLALVFSFNDIRWRIPQEIVFLVLLVVQLWLAAAFSQVWRGGAFNVMLDFSKVLPMVIVIYGAVRSMNRLRWALFVQAASAAAIAIASIVLTHTHGGRLRGVLSGVYGNSNDLALVLDLSLPLCIAMVLTTRSSWMKSAWVVVMLFMTFAVFQTASRSGAIALVVAALVCLWQLGVKQRRFYLLLLLPVAAIVIWLHGGNALRERFEETNLDSSANNRVSEASGSAQQRKEVFIQSLKVTAEHPLFGVGPGNFVIISGVWKVTHNSYTQISSEGGIPAFVLYVFILWRGIVNLRDVARHPKLAKGARVFSMGLQASLAAYIVGSFFASDAYQFFPYCLIAYTSALRLIVRRDLQASISASTTQPAPTEVEATV